MRIREPIARRWQILLSSLSIVGLIIAYGILAHQRQIKKRAAVRNEVTRVEGRLADLDREFGKLPLPTTESSQRDISARTALVNQRLRLASDVERLRLDSQTAQDRSVPTWRSLYQDGLLRVVQPQGLSRDEYWLWEDAKATATRLIVGLLVGVALSLILGLAMGCLAPIESLLLPPLAFLAKIPPTAMLAVFFVLVGTDFEMYITMIAFGTLPTLAQTIYQSAKNDVPEELIDKADTLGASQPELVWTVILQQILPRILDAVRLQVGPAMVLLVAAEWMVAGEGFGYRLRLFFQRTDMTVVFVYLIILGVAGLLIDFGLTRLRRFLCPWFGE